MFRTKAGAFVTIVASIDRVSEGGKILYVNPSTVTAAPEPAPAGGAPSPTPFDRFELSLRDAANHELLRVRPTVQISGCEAESPKKALINQDVPQLPSMKSIVLMHDLIEVDRFVSGAPSAAAGLATGMVPLRAGPPMLGKPHKLPLEVAMATPALLGVSYTVQVRPQGSPAWYTIAVGQAQPAVDLDRNQFPGVTSATVRVLRTTGFEDEVLAQDEIKLDGR